MTCDRSVFMRPVLIDSTNKDFEIGYSGAAATCALTTGTYPNVAAVLNEMATQVAAGTLDVIVDGDMEAAGVGAWTVITGVLTKEGAPHSGAQCLRGTATPAGGWQYPGWGQTILTIGRTYLVSGWARSDGTRLPYLSDTGVGLWVGTAAITWQYFSLIFIASTTDLMGTFAINGPAGGEYIEWDDIAVYNLTDGCPVDFVPSFDSNFKVQLDATTEFDLVWTDSALRDLLGFTATLENASTYTATYTPQGTWFPLRVRADNDEWYQDHKIQWKGTEARNGNACGLRTGSAIYRTTIQYDALPDYEVLRSRAATAFQDVRCLDYFVEYSREIYSTYNQMSLGGFYFYPDYTAVAIGASATWDSGNPTQFHRTSSPETFAFCNFDSDWYPKPKMTLKNCQCEWVDVDLDIHSATAPTWTGA